MTRITKTMQCPLYLEHWVSNTRQPQLRKQSWRLVVCHLHYHILHLPWPLFILLQRLPYCYQWDKENKADKLMKSQNFRSQWSILLYKRLHSNPVWTGVFYKLAYQLDEFLSGCFSWQILGWNVCCGSSLAKWHGRNYSPQLQLSSQQFWNACYNHRSILLPFGGLLRPADPK